MREPSGTFVIMHQNMWHRGTKELVGERRIMLKVIYDRTTEPIAPSWNHQATPVWTQDVLENSPWVPHTWDWMAGNALGEIDPLPGQQTARLVSQLIHVAEDEPTALRSAYILGRKADVRSDFPRGHSDGSVTPVGHSASRVGTHFRACVCSIA
jgi:hypothetical protein